MRTPAKVWKDGKFWLIEAPSLDAMTQGHTRKEALAMLEDWVRSSLGDASYEVNVEFVRGEEAILSVTDPKPLIGLMLQRARASAGLSYNEARENLGSKSRNAYRQYESGKHDPGFTKFVELIAAVGYDLEINLIKKRA